MVAYFYNGNSSIFVLVTSIFIELLLLFLGALILKNKTKNTEESLGVSGAFYALTACIVFIYPIIYIIGDAFHEFDVSGDYGYMQPFVDYKWQLLVIAISLGFGYLVDFRTLQAKSIGPFISSEVIRVSILIFAIGIIGIACVEWIEDMNDFYPSENSRTTNRTPFTFENKLFPIITIIIVRMALEIWYMKRVKIYVP